MVIQALDDHASPDEAAEALEQLGSAGLLRLEQIAKNRVRGLHHVEWADLLQEAVTRVMEGTRKWPRELPIIDFMAGVMKSLANEYWKQRKRTAEAGIVLEAETSPIGEPDFAGAIDAAPSGNPGPDRELEAKCELEAIEALFIGDEDALAIVMAKAEGYTPQKIQNDFGITATRYDSKLRKIRRKLNEYDKVRTVQ